jgi:hypothetical protein
LANGAVFVSVMKVTVTRQWQQWRLKHENVLNGELDVTSGKKNNGRSVKHVPDEFVDALAVLPLRSKPTTQGLARLLGLSQGEAHRLIKKHCRRHSSALKPTLSEEHKVASKG